MNNQQSAISNQQSFDGILIIDKPQDWTSHDVVARVRKILKTRRVGHTGTLDPFATGVLVICVNRATRLVQFLTADDKEYVATMRLGFTTDTGDLTGAPSPSVTDASHITSEQVQEALVRFRGRIQQIPPMYSAKKVGGVRLHEMARRGETIQRQPIEVEIKELELIPNLNYEVNSVSEFSLRVVCSSGTYIRTLAEDIGRALGVGAHLTSLRRTRAGQNKLDQAVTLEQLGLLAEAGKLDEALIPLIDTVTLAEIRINDEECKALIHGRSIPRKGNWADGERAKLCNNDRQLLAIAEYNFVQSAWFPRVVLANGN